MRLEGASIWGGRSYVALVALAALGQTQCAAGAPVTASPASATPTGAVVAAAPVCPTAIAVAPAAAPPPAPPRPTSGPTKVTMFRCDPQRTGVCAASELAKEPKVVWSLRTAHLNRSSPTVTGGSVYVGSNDGTMYALVAATGEVRWRFHVDGEISSSPATALDSVFFSAGDGVFYALDVQTGAVRWSFKMGEAAPYSSPYHWDFYQSSPAIVGETVYVGGNDGNVYALAARTGALIWRFATQGRVASSPAVDGDTVFVGGMDGHVYALDAATGAPRWTFKTSGNAYSSGEVQGSPAVARGMVYVGSRDATLYALDEKTGAKRWATKEHNGSWIVSSPAVAGSRVVYGTSDNHTVRAANADTGKIEWTYDAVGRVLASPTVVGDRVFVGLANSGAVWLDVATGKELGGVYSEGTVYTTPAVADGMLFFGSDDGFIYAAR